MRLTSAKSAGPNKMSGGVSGRSRVRAAIHCFDHGSIIVTLGELFT